MADLGHGKDYEFDKSVVINTGNTIAYQTSPTLTADEELANKKYVDDNDSILDLDRLVSVSTSGNAANSGKNADQPITSIVTAMSDASALTPSFVDPVLVDILDGGDFTYGASGFTIPAYVKLDMRGSTLNGSDVKLNDNAVSNINVHSVSAVGYLKALGTVNAIVNADRFFVGAAEGIRSTAGRIEASFKTVDITGGNLIAQLSSSDINVDVSGAIVATTTGLVATHDGAGRVNMRLNDVISAADGFRFQGGTGYNTLSANHVSVAGQAFNIPTAGMFLTAICGEVEEVSASDTTYLNYIFGLYRRSGDTYDLYTRIKNAQNGIVLETTGSAPIVFLSEGITQTVHTDNVSNPPTDAELDAIFGTPAAAGTGFRALIDDNGGGANFYEAISDGTNWWLNTFTKAV